MRGIGRGRLPTGAGAGSSINNSRNVNNSTTSSVNSPMHIGAINITAHNANADHLAREIGPAIHRNSLSQQFNYGVV